MPSVTYKPFIPRVIKVNAVMVSVVAPNLMVVRGARNEKGNILSFLNRVFNSKLGCLRYNYNYNSSTRTPASRVENSAQVLSFWLVLHF
jgi:hypothetical protein